MRLTEDEMREVHRILLEYTARLRDYADAIGRTVAILARPRVLFAKAQFAVDFGCNIPRFSPAGARRWCCGTRGTRCRRRAAPAKTQVIPVIAGARRRPADAPDQRPEQRRQNGHLEDHGLLALMAQAGLPVPAAEAEFRSSTACWRISATSNPSGKPQHFSAHTVGARHLCKVYVKCARAHTCSTLRCNFNAGFA